MNSSESKIPSKQVEEAADSSGRNSSNSSLSSFFDSPSTELRQESWVNLVLAPALSTRSITPGGGLHLTFKPVERVTIVELKGRLVGFSEIVPHYLYPEKKERHEFLSVPFTFVSSFLDPFNDESAADSLSLSTNLTLPLKQTCSCSRIDGGTAISIPLPPSYERKGNRISYFLEVVGKIDDSRGMEDKKGKGKWKLIGNKLKSERLEIPFYVEIDSQYDSRRSSPPPLAREETYRTYPISQETIEASSRMTVVELKEPRPISLAAKVHSAKLIVDLNSSADASNRLQPSFKYTLLASLGRHFPSTLPLLSASLQLATSYAHFVLHESTTINTPSQHWLTTKRVIPLLFRGAEGSSRSDPLDAGFMHRGQPGTIDGKWELVMDAGDDDDTPKEVVVKFEGEFEVEPHEGGLGDGEEENQLIPIRTCQLEIRYDLTATFQFGSDYDSLVMLKSTNLPLHLDSSSIRHSLSDTETTLSHAFDSEKKEAVAKLESGDTGLKSPSRASPHPTASTSLPLNAPELPAYDDSQINDSRDLPLAEEKQASNRHEELATSTSTIQPPSYTGTSSSHAPEETPARRSEGPDALESPPSWEETVRDDMIDDWVAASVAFGVE